jgi:hypothetical protein
MGLSKQDQAAVVMLTPTKKVMTVHRQQRHHRMTLKKQMVTLHSEEADGDSGALPSCWPEDPDQQGMCAGFAPHPVWHAWGRKHGRMYLQVVRTFCLHGPRIGRK